MDKIKFLIVISGGKFGGKFGMPELASNAYSKIIDIPSLHFIGNLKKPKCLMILCFNKFYLASTISFIYIVRTNFIDILLRVLRFAYNFFNVYNNLSFK